MKPSRYPLILALVSLVLLSAVPLPGAEPADKPEKPASADVPLVDEQIRQFMQDRNYAEAVKAIDGTLQKIEERLGEIVQAISDGVGLGSAGAVSARWVETTLTTGGSDVRW